MFKKLLASIGIGAAQVDTRLYDETVAPGGDLVGEIVVRGGDVAQEIETIYLYLDTYYLVESDDRAVTKRCVLVKQAVSERFTIGPDESRSLPFRLRAPLQTPLSAGRQSVYLRTGLDIRDAIDPTDTDRIKVVPHLLQQRLFDAVERLGFHLHHAQNEYNHRSRGPYPFVQEFEFRPSGYRSSVKELELICTLDAYGLDVRLEIDRRLRGLGRLFEDFDFNERYARLYFPNADLERDDWESLIDQAIQERVQ